MKVEVSLSVEEVRAALESYIVGLVPSRTVENSTITIFSESEYGIRREFGTGVVLVLEDKEV